MADQRRQAFFRRQSILFLAAMVARHHPDASISIESSAQFGAEPLPLPVIDHGRSV
jgi:hypothetical protein